MWEMYAGSFGPYGGRDFIARCEDPVAWILENKHRGYNGEIHTTEGPDWIRFDFMPSGDFPPVMIVGMRRGEQ